MVHGLFKAKEKHSNNPSNSYLILTKVCNVQTLSSLLLITIVNNCFVFTLLFVFARQNNQQINSCHLHCFSIRLSFVFQRNHLDNVVTNKM